MCRKLLFIFLLFISISTLAQHNGAVTGRVSEAWSAQPLEFVTLVLMKPGERAIIRQEVTDSKGQYKISGLVDGTYCLIASYIGLENLKTNSFTISTGAKRIVQDISLKGGPKNLNEVRVTGKRPFYSNSIDRKVYNVDQDMMDKSGLAGDVLQDVPLVQVDIDGNVSLRNSSAPILINGKVLLIMVKNAATALQQLPANSIERIEAIANPSAKYKSDGMGGVINTIQVNSNCRSAGLWPRGKYLPGFALDFGERQELFKKEGSVYLTLSHIFISQRQKAELSSIGLVQDVFTNSSSRFACMGMSYNLGIEKNKKDLHI